jgi:benzoyl-CoA 2,3-epoxidase subunit A
MNALVDNGILKQHLIDPVVCIRCNTCEATCPVGAITHDDRNYVVRADICNGCMACVAPCPTGSIDHWHPVALNAPYSIEEQLVWDDLPELQDASTIAVSDASAVPAAMTQPVVAPVVVKVSPSSTIPPWSAAHAYTNLYTAKSTAQAKVTGNLRITEKDSGSDTHHVVLDLGSVSFPVLEGQSIAIAPPGLDALGRPHMPRQYSIASARDGERAGYNNLSITVKRVTEHEGQPYFGVASNFVCDLKVGDTVNIVGPFGSTFLMPNHPQANLLMICTGTGSAPMRGFTERVRREAQAKKSHGKLMLFFGARTQGELPYFGSRTPNEPKKYVQDVMIERASDVAALLKDEQTYIYVCGLKGMETGVLEALETIAKQAGMDWQAQALTMKSQGRIHFETY